MSTGNPAVLAWRSHTTLWFRDLGQLNHSTSGTGRGVSQIVSSPKPGRWKALDKCHLNQSLNLWGRTGCFRHVFLEVVEV